MTYTSITVIPDAGDIKAVDNSPGLVRVDLAADVHLIFSTHGAHDGRAALDALHEAIRKAYELLQGVSA